MKFRNIILGALAVAAVATSCEKHELLYEGTTFVGDAALFHICYFAPVAVNTTNAIDSVYVNDKFTAGIGGTGQLAVCNLVPTSGTRYFTAPKGSTHIQFFKKGEVIYDKYVTLESGKQDIYVPALTLEPVVIATGDYNNKSPRANGLEQFNTDSIASVRLINFLWEPDGNGGVKPTERKCQYQWRDNTGEKDVNGEYYWHNIGGPIAFGEASDREQIIIHKSTFNSSGYVRINYRVIDQDGNQMTTDYWTGDIGRAYDHIYKGVYGTPLPSGYVKAAYTQFTML